MTKDITDTIGCDLGDRKTDICVLDADGKTTRLVVATTRAAMTAFLQRSPAHVVMEVGAHSRWVSELAERMGHRVTVANARQIQLITRSDSKRDERDAELLARLGRADVKLLSPVKHRGTQTQADLAVPKSRDLLVRTRTALINHIRGVVKSFGHRFVKCSSESFVRKTRDLVPEPLKLALRPIYDVLDSIEQQIRGYDRAIDRVATERYPDVAVLTQVHGVGTLTALSFLLTLEDKARFTSSRMAGAFLGLRPRRSQSGGDDPQLRITKAGDGFVRRLLVNAANHVLGPFGKDSDLRRWGIELGKRGGKNARKRAKIAVARKLAVLLHRLWVTGEVFQPLGYGPNPSAEAA